jgi:hypothetical protein
MFDNAGSSLIPYDDQQQYDNKSHETLDYEVSILRELLEEFSRADGGNTTSRPLRIIATRDNSESCESGAHTEDYYVLERRSLTLEKQLAASVNKWHERGQLGRRYTLIKINHPFKVKHGSEVSYVAEEVTLAFKRDAFLVEEVYRRDVSAETVFRFKHVCGGSALLLLLAYAILHLWRLFSLS